MNPYGPAVASLRDAGVEVKPRKASSLEEAGDSELDIWLEANELRTADTALELAGFHRVRVSGHAPHRFYVMTDGRAWHKIDAKVRNRRATRARSIVRHAPAGMRRYGPVVAVLGPDGAGKSTLLAELEDLIPLRVHVAYLGRSRRVDASGEPAPKRLQGRARRVVDSPAFEVLFVVRSLLRNAVKILRAHLRAWSGAIVVCDRHPIEALAIQPRRAVVARWLERFVIENLLPWPDAIIVLDAAAETLYARKSEHPIERLETWRRRYRSEFQPRGARFIATDEVRDQARSELASHVFGALTARGGSGRVEMRRFRTGMSRMEEG